VYFLLKNSFISRRLQQAPILSAHRLRPRDRDGLGRRNPRRLGPPLSAQEMENAQKQAVVSVEKVFVVCNPESWGCILGPEKKSENTLKKR
jgi:hypothetical protein